MVTERRLQDYLRPGTWSDVATSLGRIRERFQACCNWIRDNLERNDRHLAYFNLLNGAQLYLSVAHENIGGPIQVLALSTRGLFELDVRVRHLLMSPANLDRWKAESVTDRIEIIEGILRLRTRTSEADARTLEAEIVRLTDTARRHNVAERIKIPGVARLAREVGLGTDYDALFKLFSKLLHPTAYFVNSPSEEVHGLDNRNILAVTLQVYAEDMLERIRSALGVPEAVVRDPARTEKSRPV